MMRRASLGLLAVSLFVCVQARAEEVTIGQRDRQFEKDSASVKVGDTIKFVNNDDVAHNVMTQTPDGDLHNSGVQRPGDTVTVDFRQPGTYQVRCGIHPKMKMTVTVE